MQPAFSPVCTALAVGLQIKNASDAPLLTPSPLTAHRSVRRAGSTPNSADLQDKTFSRGRLTCKRVRVGARFRVAAAGGGATTRTLVMDPLKQLAGCGCFNIREHVRLDMYSKPNRKHPAHFLAPLPVTVAPTARACVPAKTSGGACRKQFINTGTATISCQDGGALNITFAGSPGSVIRLQVRRRCGCFDCLVAVAAGFKLLVGLGCMIQETEIAHLHTLGMLSLLHNTTHLVHPSIFASQQHNVVATCANSELSAMSSCSISNSPATAASVQTAGRSLALRGGEWGPDCVCPSGRRPVIKIEPQVSLEFLFTS